MTIRYPDLPELLLLAMTAQGDHGFGAVWRGPRGKGWVVDCRPYGLIYGLGRARFEKEEIAEAVLNMIRVAIGRGASPAEACSPYLSQRSKQQLVAHRYGQWISIQEQRAQAGDLSPRTVAEYRRYAREGGELDFWRGQSVFDVTEAGLEAWSLELATQRKLSPKTRRNVLAAFRTFFSWLKKGRVVRAVPGFPAVEVPEYAPTVISRTAQGAILDAFTDPVERLSHAIAARCGLRCGELRALSVSDYLGRDEDGVARLLVRRAMKGLSADAELRSTKNRQVRTLPLPDDLADELEALWPKAARLQADPDIPLVSNPRTSKRWSHGALRQSWLRGCKAAGVPAVPLYEGTKHSAATDMLGASKDLEAVRKYLGHRDARSTEKYARVMDGALLELARRRS